MIDEMNYLNAFFENLSFFKSINNKNNAESKRLFTYLKDPSNIVFQQEIDEWLKIAYEHKIVDDFKKRLSDNITFIDLSCILNELMVAHFVHTMLNMRIKQYSPAVKDNKMADWLFEKDIREMAGITDEKAPVILDLESVRAIGSGKFEIDLVNLFRKDRPLIYKLEEGKYIIDLASTLGKGVGNLKEIKNPYDGE